ncbi:TPA: hypothetical protein JIZ13_06520 [Acinetobacter nosocomialis]|uniref:Uncharacterized protein n=1 Tax=Acinetobacter pittii TaxID=48296 RepID=A0A4Y3JA62_ACIPI|nr:MULTISPECIES: hypothetical protein [Acinetobacter]EHU1404385.1 hypothetical protein [Acinetobacter baumannii]EHU1901894.1 hypothetical protein [Acinetobacter baumannii]EHU2565925.1 hypothetical protein [Acinetobacter baumannii]EHU2572985.1 hypothetical protein [Acinetobacter baumannii]EIB6854506.1 hypothetical protein [Acinetobacter baumannii]
MRLSIFCRKRGCSQLIDLSQMDCLQVSQSEHRGGMVSESFYDVFISLKSGFIFDATIEDKQHDKLLELIECDQKI